MINMTENESRYVIFDGGFSFSVEDKENEMPTILFHDKNQATEFLNHLQNQEKQIWELEND